MVKTHSMESYHERQIYISERVIEHAQRALAKIALRDQLRLFEPEPAPVIPLRQMTEIDLSAS